MVNQTFLYREPSWFQAYTKCNLGKSVLSAWEGVKGGIGKTRYQDGSMLLLVQGVGTQSRQFLQNDFYFMYM